MTFRIAVLAGLTTFAATAGCTEMLDDPDPEITAAARDEIRIPDVVPYVRDRVDGRALVPDDVRYIHLAYTPGPDKSFYVWGLADGSVRYIYQLFTDDDDADFGHKFLVTVREREQIGSVRGHSIAGTPRTGEPVPPTPVGQPPFSQDYAYAVVTAANATQTATLDMLDTLDRLVAR